MLFPVRTLHVSCPTGSIPHQVLVASSASAHAHGFQHVDLATLPRGLLGMLFVWPTDARRTVHMQNVRFDLTCYFFDCDGWLRTVLDMPVGAKPVRANACYLLEVPSGVAPCPGPHGMRIALDADPGDLWLSIP